MFIGVWSLSSKRCFIFLVVVQRVHDNHGILLVGWYDYNIRGEFQELSACNSMCFMFYLFDVLVVRNRCGITGRMVYAICFASFPA